MSKPVSVKYKKDGNTFEILVNHGTVDTWRNGKLGWGKVAYADAVFKNASKGDRYTDNDLMSTFGTSNVDECMKIIAEKGELQLTTADRRKKMEETRKQIVNYIHKYYINPKTNAPHPLINIDNALKEQRYNVTEESVERQVQKIMKKMIMQLPMKKNEITLMRGTFTIPIQHIGKVQGVLSKTASILSQNYTSKESTVEVEFNSGDFENLNVMVLQASQNTSTFEATNSNNKGNNEKKNGSKDGKSGKKKKKRN